MVINIDEFCLLPTVQIKHINLSIRNFKFFIIHNINNQKISIGINLSQENSPIIVCHIFSAPAWGNQLAQWFSFTSTPSCFLQHRVTGLLKMELLDFSFLLVHASFLLDLCPRKYNEAISTFYAKE